MKKDDGTKIEANANCLQKKRERAGVLSPFSSAYF